MINDADIYYTDNGRPIKIKGKVYIPSDELDKLYLTAFSNLRYQKLYNIHGEHTLSFYDIKSRGYLIYDTINENIND